MGEDAHFRCEVSQEGVTHAEWWLGSNHLQHNDLNQIRFQGREHHLVLRMVTPEESGDVAFVVGEEKSVASLLVQHKPKGNRRHDGSCVHQLSSCCMPLVFGLHSKCHSLPFTFIRPQLCSGRHIAFPNIILLLFKKNILELK